jgi:DNA-binding beta-propeller fold protein YncE
LPTSHPFRHAAGLVPAVALLVAAAPAAQAAPRPADIIELGGAPQALAVDTATGSVWVAVNEISSQDITEIVGGKVRATIPLGSVTPLDIAVDAHTGTVWVADGGFGTVTEISAKTATVLRTITLQQANADDSSIAVDPEHGEVFVTEISLDDLVEFSESDPDTQYVTSGGNTPLAIAVYPAQRTAWVTDGVGDVTEVSYTGTRPKDIYTLKLRGGPGNITADAATGRIFVSQFSSNAVAIINAASRKVSTVKVGEAPGALNVDPLHGDVWVATANGLSEFPETAHRVSATYPLGFSPSGVAAVPNAGVYAANFRASNVLFLPAGLRLHAPRSVSFRTGRHGLVLITASGFPATSVSLSGRLPTGLRWATSGPNGRIAGTPRSGTQGTYHLTVQASTIWRRHLSHRLTITITR